MKTSIIDDAVSLPVEKRVELIDILIQSLIPPVDKTIDKLWAREADKRFRDLKKRKVKAIPADAVFSEIHKRLAK
ncbi:MAG: hypothetical protein A2W19_06060 [Spirochaetes bacterium RBG_16_49_21]|nr:MAG: hypothetical protein A2W19_06060 [Spirochaetes bacterium RBG_16_49_21]